MRPHLAGPSDQTAPTSETRGDARHVDRRTEAGRARAAAPGLGGAARDRVPVAGPARARAPDGGVFLPLLRGREPTRCGARRGGPPRPPLATQGRRGPPVPAEKEEE